MHCRTDNFTVRQSVDVTKHIAVIVSDHSRPDIESDSAAVDFADDESNPSSDENSQDRQRPWLRER